MASQGLRPPAPSAPAPPAAPRLTSTEVKRALDDPRALCDRLGLAQGARRQRGGVMVLCPWHAERTPSCSVRVAEDGTVAVRCHACGASGDALSLVAAARGLDVRRDFPQVLAEAAKVAGIEAGAAHARPLAKAGAAARGRARYLRPAPALEDTRFAAIAEVILEAGRLDDSPIARDVSRYLAQRKLLDLAREDGWAALPPAGEAQAAWVRMLVDVYGRRDVELSGLVWRRGRGFCVAHPAHRLVIPWRSPEGVIYTLQRRRIDGEDEKKYVFPAGRPARWPYGIERVRQGESLAIVEGAIDALALRWLLRRDAMGGAVVGLAGVQSWDAAWARFAGVHAIIGLDADRAGHLAVGGIAHDLVLAGVEHLERRKPRSGKDWADTLMAERPA